MAFSALGVHKRRVWSKDVLCVAWVNKHTYNVKQIFHWNIIQVIVKIYIFFLFKDVLFFLLFQTSVYLQSSLNTYTLFYLIMVITYLLYLPIYEKILGSAVFSYFFRLNPLVHKVVIGELALF